MAFYDRAWMSVASTGTGTITLGAAVSGFRSFASAGVADQALMSYTIVDGTNWEIGRGTYTASGTTLTRGVIASSAGGTTAIAITASATIFADLLAADLAGFALLTGANFTGALSSASFATGSVTITSGGGNVISVASDGADNDNASGSIGVTRGTSGNLTYYAMTRAGNVVWGMGIDVNNNVYIGPSGNPGNSPIIASYGAGGAARFLAPGADNAFSLGLSSNRWSAVYAASGTISTSDERQKQDIKPIDDALLDAWADMDWCSFRFVESVAEKGDRARVHFGLVAQHMRDVFQIHGIDGLHYGVLCYDRWAATPAVAAIEAQDAVVDDEGRTIVPAVEGHDAVPAKPAGDIWGVRYDLASSIEAAYQRRRADRLEARIAALESLRA